MEVQLCQFAGVTSDTLTSNELHSVRFRACRCNFPRVGCPWERSEHQK